MTKNTFYSFGTKKLSTQFIVSSVNQKLRFKSLLRAPFNFWQMENNFFLIHFQKLNQFNIFHFSTLREKSKKLLVIFKNVFLSFFQKFPDLKFKYVEEEKPEEFFIPYVWSLVGKSSGIYWNAALYKLW